MTRTKSLAAAFYLTAVLVGAAIGVTVDRWVLRDSWTREMRDPRAMRGRIAETLAFDSTQRAGLDSILDTRNHRMDSLMAPVRPGIDSVSREAREAFDRLLTPEQRTKYEQWRRDREAGRRQERE
ncbi:MAG: hypothetical protein ACKORK_03260 [Gemmatimonadota bacterium]